MGWTPSFTPRRPFRCRKLWEQWYEHACTCQLERRNRSCNMEPVQDRLGRSNVQKTIHPAKLQNIAVIKEAEWLQDHTSGTSTSQELTTLHNSTIMYFLGAIACTVAAVALWAFWRSRNTTGFWRRSQKQAYERLSPDDDENTEFFDQDDTHLGEKTLVDEGSDTSDTIVKSSSRPSSPC